MRDLEEHVLRSEMFAEACELLASTDLFRGLAPRGINVTKDDGRYTREVLADARRLTESRLAELVAGTHFEVRYGSSQSTPGLQVADVIANALNRAIRQEAPEPLLAPMMPPGRLRVSSVKLSRRRPAWALSPAG